MDAAQTNTLRYFKTALESEDLPKVNYSENEKYWRLTPRSVKTLRNGHLSEKLTNEIFRAYFEEYGISEERRPDIRSIEILLSLVSAKKGGEIFGLLNMTCDLSRSGDLTCDRQPWISYDRLLTENVEPTNTPVGDLGAFWNFRLETSEEFKKTAKTWQDYMEYAQTLFDQVSNDADSNFKDSDEDLITSDVYIKFANSEPKNRSIIDLYKRLTGEEEAPQLLQSIMTPKDSHTSAREIDADGKIFTNMCLTSASMSKDEPLDEPYRLAMHAFVCMNEGDILAINIPSSDAASRSKVLQSAMADLLVSHVLKGLPAPLIVATCADDRDVGDLMQTFSYKKTEESTLLDVRWLPVCSQQGNAQEKAQMQRDSEQDEAPIDPLQIIDSLTGFAAYCSQASAASDTCKFELVEDIKKEGIYSQYSSRPYVEDAVRAIQLFSDALFGAKATDLKIVQAHLFEWLAVLEKVRQSLIEAVGDFRSEFPSLIGKIDKEDEQPIATFDKQIKEANEHRSMSQKLLDYWTQLDESRPTKGVFRKTAVMSDEDFIAENRNQHDVFDDSLKTVEEIKNYYQGEVKKYEGISGDVQAMRDTYTQKQAAYDEACSLAKSCLDRLTGNKTMSRRIEKFNSNFNLYDKDMPVKLDDLIDTTVRYVEFWLGVHYYECQWLLDCTASGTIIEKALRRQRSEEIQTAYWSQITSLAPCFVMTANQLPQYFMLYKKGTQEPDLERIDLLIVDNAEQISTPMMVGSFALAKKALVVGDALQLCPIWSFTTDIDEEIAKSNGVQGDWQKRAESGLTASVPSNMMRAAISACMWDFDKPGNSGKSENEEQESETPTENTPVEEAPTDQEPTASAEDAPADQEPAEDAPTDQSASEK